MKSPNAVTSVKLIKTSEQAIKAAYEDLKNDPRVRDSSGKTQSLLDRMKDIEKSLQSIQATLKDLGY